METLTLKNTLIVNKIVPKYRMFATQKPCTASPALYVIVEHHPFLFVTFALKMNATKRFVSNTNASYIEALKLYFQTALFLFLTINHLQNCNRLADIE